MSKYVIAKYIRLSLEDSKYDSLSITNQHLLLNRHIESLEIENAEIIEFVDNGYSGVNFERPGIQNLLDLVRESKIDCIIVKDFSRFGRNSIETGYFIEMVFPLFRTRFISISDNFDSNNYTGDTGGMEVAFKFLMNEFYSQDISKKGKTAKYSKMKRGEYQSQICLYGYQKGKDGRLEVDTEAAEVVKLIFAEALNMKSASDIVKILYERKIVPPGEYRKMKGTSFHDLSRSIGIWQRSAVLRILADERYMGTYVMSKRTVKEIGGNRSRLKPEEEWFKIPNHHTPIISSELFKEVNDKLLHFKCPKKNRDYLFKSKLFCGCCLHAMNYRPRKTPSYICRYTSVDETAKCHKLEIKEQKLEELLFDIINKQAQIILSADGIGDTSELTVKAEEHTEYEKLLENCNEEKRILYERYVVGEITAEEYKKNKTSIDVEIQRFTQAINTLKTDTAKLTLAGESNKELKEIAKAVSESGKLNSTLVDRLIDKIYVYPDNEIEIIWKISDFCISV